MTKRYTSGQPFIPKAEQFNRYERAAERTLGQKAKAKPSTSVLQQAQVVWAKNETGATINKGECFKISSAPWGPINGTAESEIWAGLSNTGISAAATTDNELGQWAVAAQTIPDSTLGKAFVAGVFFAKVKTGDTDGAYAEMESGSSVLVTRPCSFAGSAQILEGTPDTQGAWCLVRYIGFEPYLTFAVEVSHTGGSAGDKTTKCSYTYTAKTIQDLTELGTSLSPEFDIRTANGKYVQADRGTGYFDGNGTFVLWQVNEVPAIKEC